jgi:hypothetical protein
MKCLTRVVRIQNVQLNRGSITFEAIYASQNTTIKRIVIAMIVQINFSIIPIMLYCHMHVH